MMNLRRKKSCNEHVNHHLDILSNTWCAWKNRHTKKILRAHENSCLNTIQMSSQAQSRQKMRKTPCINKKNSILRKTTQPSNPRFPISSFNKK
jgi:hypothetical protein